MPPKTNRQGEITEGQTLEEGEIFYPDRFLQQFIPTNTPTCPRHMTPMKFNSIQRPYGSTWEYYRCPSSRWWTRYYVTCGAHEVDEYLKRVSEQTHPSYQKIDPCLFRCQCDKSLILATSHSVKNPNRLYLKCPRSTCKFFQWIDEPPTPPPPPRGLADAILIKGENPTKRDASYFFLFKKPQTLFYKSQ